MAKTLATLDERTIIDNIELPELKDAFGACCAVARGESPASTLALKAKNVYELQKFADKLTDLGKAISEAVKNAEGVHHAETGEVTEGFKIRNTGSTVTVTDAGGLVKEAEALGYNGDELRKRLTISANDAKKAMGIDADRFAAEFADYIEIKKKADSLQRAW